MRKGTSKPVLGSLATGTSSECKGGFSAAFIALVLCDGNPGLYNRTFWLPGLLYKVLYLNCYELSLSVS